MPLVLRERQDTSDVVILGRLLFFREVADEVCAVRITLSLWRRSTKFERSMKKAYHHVVHERGHVVVKCLVIQETLGDQTEISTVRELFAAVDLEKRDISFAVDLITRRAEKRATLPVTSEHEVAWKIGEAKFANIENRQMRVFLRIRREVPFS